MHTIIFGVSCCTALAKVCVCVCVRGESNRTLIIGQVFKIWCQNAIYGNANNMCTRAHNKQTLTYVMGLQGLKWDPRLTTIWYPEKSHVQ